MLYQAINLSKFNRYKFEDIHIGDTCTLHNGREAIKVKILGKNEQRELLKGEVLFFLIYGEDWKKGDSLLFSAENISGIQKYDTNRTD